MTQDYRNKIKNLVEVNPGQCTYKEYAYIAEMILNIRPANILVFGLGNDSYLWNDLNENGTTVFLEHNPEWLNSVKVPHKHKVKYKTKKDQWKAYYKGALNIPRLPLPDKVLDTEWDLIFIDSPENHKHGRMQSIHTASLLKCNEYLIHDCHREIEYLFADKYLGKFINQIHKLQHYRQV